MEGGWEGETERENKTAREREREGKRDKLWKKRKFWFSICNGDSAYNKRRKEKTVDSERDWLSQHT